MIYDSLLVLALWMITLFPIVAVSNAAVHGPAVRAVLFLELYGFFAYFWMRGGQTLGMVAWRLELRTDDGGPFTLGGVTRRFLAALASFVCLGMGYLWILFDPARRSWSDIASGSHVLYRPGTPT